LIISIFLPDSLFSMWVPANLCRGGAPSPQSQSDDGQGHHRRPCAHVIRPTLDLGMVLRTTRAAPREIVTSPLTQTSV